MKLTFLGTGTSFGVPQIGCSCAVCRSEDPRDKRTRVGAVVEDAGLRLLLDTPPELRLQLIAAQVDRVDAVLYTHEHADHTHGIDDVRAISVRRDGALPMYGPKETLQSLQERFPYIFDAAMKPLPGTSKPEGFAHPLEPGVTVRIGHLDVTPVALPHGRIRVFGYRIGPLAYVTDAKELPDDAVAVLRGAEVLVLNALFRTSHPTHLSLGEAVDAAARIGARQTFFTHLTHETAHAALEAALPEGIAPAYDGLSVEF
ncbi:MAG TPA: MBL fold metallo-hydrolase [Gemmatimonadaceae bacterium]|nr:MBL fold metallo-hydrolase [Gemmatimonadaceae bacterium]HRQ79353.1 MBL fold metallo-hydrolase [Gemmatimonadaceae bacterium]